MLQILKCCWKYLSKLECNKWIFHWVTRRTHCYLNLKINIILSRFLRLYLPVPPFNINQEYITDTHFVMYIDSKQ